MVKQWKLVIPDVVLCEISNKITRRELESTLKFSIYESESHTMEALRARYVSLGDGELGAVSCALGHQSGTSRVIVALDDRIARSVAKRLGLRVIGTLGILRLMFEAKIITRKELKDCCHSLGKLGFHVTNGLLTEIMQPCKNGR
jgi:hypothetical protein